MTASGRVIDWAEAQISASLTVAREALERGHICLAQQELQTVSRIADNYVLILGQAIIAPNAPCESGASTLGERENETE